MLIALCLLAWLTVLSSCTASQMINRPSVMDRQLQSRCSTANDKESLEVRSANADVVLTGTVVKLMPEMTTRVLEPKKHRRASSRRSVRGRTITAHVKIWTVMKGSVDDVSNNLRLYRKRKRSSGLRRDFTGEVFSKRGNRKARSSTHVVSAAKGLDKSVIELHGLWNSHMCGTFLKEGDTRVFFLRKMEDQRLQHSLRERRNSKKHRRRKHKGKKRGRKSKKRKHKKKNKINKHLSTPSVATTFRTAAVRRNKVASVKRIKSKSKTIPMQPPLETKKTSVLLINYDPARITLNNLRSVESLIRA